MSKLVGECKCYDSMYPCPREKGVKDKVKCSWFREDCVYYVGTVEPRRNYSPEYHGNSGGIADGDFKGLVCSD